MQNQTAFSIKNLTPPNPPPISPTRFAGASARREAKQGGLGGVPPNPPPYFKGGLGGVIARFKNAFTITILAGTIVLFFSFLGFLFPYFREIIFFTILAAILILSICKLEYGLYAAVVELVLGSKGYLLYSDFGGYNVSLRIGIFLVVLGVFFAKLILKKISLNWNKNLIWYIPFFVLIALGFFHGLFRNYGFQNVFLDANGYFYLFYLFPFLSIFQNREKIKKIQDVLLSSGLILAIFSLFLFYIFSHDWLNSDLIYRWLRNNLLFEITYSGSVFRIFAQSQIFLLMVFFLALNYFVPISTFSPSLREGELGGEGNTQKKKFYLAIIVSFFSLTGILVSLSRSFFVGLLAGLFVFCAVVFLKNKKEFIKILFVVILICFASVAFLWTIEPREPYALIGRTASIKPSTIETEPANLTRREELKPLLSEIIKKPFLGWGFGKTVTFETHDPRALTTLPQCIGKTSCLFTTYAFEWGYLDLWLKLGLFGLVSLFGILYILFREGWRELNGGGLVLRLVRRSLKGEGGSIGEGGWILSSLAAVAVTNIFSPYLNHPLGLGILIILVVELFAIKVEN